MVYSMYNMSMKNYFSKIIITFCLFIYFLFGFLNSGAFGFCLGNELNPHFGSIISGHKTCCYDNDKNTGIHSDCNDVQISSTTVNQLAVGMRHFNFESVCLFYNNVFSYIITYPHSVTKDEPVCYQNAPPNNLITDVIKDTVVLLI